MRCKTHVRPPCRLRHSYTRISGQGECLIQSPAKYSLMAFDTVVFFCGISCICNYLARKESIIMAHALSTRPIHSVRNLTVTILVVWFLLAVGGSLLGVFDSEPSPPLPLGLAAVIPVALFAFCYLTWVRFQEFVLSLDLRILTVAQTWRVGGIVFLILYQHGALPRASAHFE